MVLISIENIVSSLEARKREREYIEELKANLNMVKAYRSQEETNELGKIFRENDKEEKKEYDKIYRENNKDRKRENDKIYRENNGDKLLAKVECACGNTYVHKKEVQQAPRILKIVRTRLITLSQSIILLITVAFPLSFAL